MQRILFIIPYVPYPLTSGGNQAFFNMIDFLRFKMDVSILLSPQTKKDEENAADLKELWNNVTFFIFSPATFPEVRNPVYYKWLTKVKASIKRKMKRQLLVAEKKKKDISRSRSTLFFSIFKSLRVEYLDYVSTIVKQGFDIIQVEFYELISLGYLLPENVETVFVHHELRYIRNENEMLLFDEVTDNERVLQKVAKDFEYSALQRYKHIITLTEIDRELLSDFLGRKERIYASPAIVQIPSRSECEFIPGSNRLTFIGSEDHYPNLDAVDWFCRKIAPCLRRKGFCFTFQVIGKWESSYAKDLLTLCPELELVGYIEDLCSCLQGSIGVVPIRIGSGMRMKILDAVFSNIPLVTTAKGVEGIELHNGKECLVANDADDFANLIIKLASDADLQKQLVDLSSNRLQQLYNPQKMLNRRLDIYNQILTHKA